MAQFSTKADVKDPILAGVTQEEDHKKAERELLMELKAAGVNPETIDDASVLKDLSVAYASWQRCILETREKDDAFDVKARHYKGIWNDGVGKLNRYVDAAPVERTGGSVYGLNVTIERW
ncbi:MAG: hypothetical protein P1V51_20125 [Deltaproteobacteria bacterium]|nr:hypothetical protein [Deltaproteobacteria bacterium]